MKNYYKILDVEPDSDFNRIKRAFRKKALEHHPDRGGTHAEMVKINEAWEVLSNTQLRQQYDNLLKNGKRDSQFFDEAKQRAQTYEKSWDKFDKWLSVIGRDFASAQYGSTKFTIFTLPTGKGSMSAWIFIVTGGFIGICIASSVAMPFGSAIEEAEMGLKRALLVLGMGAVVFGAWMGQMLHESIANTLNSSESSQTSKSAGSAASEPSDREKTNNPRKTDCPSCNQRLRLPALGKQLSVTCPNCRHQFQFNS